MVRERERVVIVRGVDDEKSMMMMSIACLLSQVGEEPGRLCMMVGLAVELNGLEELLLLEQVARIL